MARDWFNYEATIIDLMQRMDKFGKNVAPVPFCMYQELLPDGVTVWVVDLHIKVLGVTDFDLQGVAETRWEALRKAYLGLNNEPGLLRVAAKANKEFGVLA